MAGVFCRAQQKLPLEQGKLEQETAMEPPNENLLADQKPSLSLNDVLSPASFWSPDKLVNSAWLEHAPFAFWLVNAMRPRSIVELGTHHGYSYLAFCQAVKRLDLRAQCYAVDTWQGDVHSGQYTDDVYQNLKAYHDTRFAEFSRMVRTRFDEAAEHFGGGTIDLLHIDGRHFYDDVKADFEIWRSKLSSRAVVLFHDTNVRERGFGVWRLWQELAPGYPSFEFLHGHGLGVLGYGSDLAAPIDRFFSVSLKHASAVREVYHRLGVAITDRFAREGDRATQHVSQKSTSSLQPPVLSVEERPNHRLHIHLAAMAPQFLDVRTDLPLQELSGLAGVSVSKSERAIELPRLPPDQPKVAIIQRISIHDRETWLNAIATMESKGWVVIGELDDHPELIARVHGGEVTSESWNSVALMHAVQTSTDLLAAEFRRHNPEVMVFRNAVFNAFRGRLREQSHTVRVFYGALNREAFSSQVARAIFELAQARQDLEFEVVHDRAFFDGLSDCRKTFHPASSYADYMKLMASCDICLIPLEGRPGEEFKSDLKFLEASSLGLASIVSPVVYEQTVADGRTALVAHSLEDWPRLLALLLEDPLRRTRIATAAREEMSATRTFGAQSGFRIAWYRSLWERRAELRAALKARVAARTK
ncbi:class I SAM-dependent methyltransferase [Bradyrhizobium liaoningense]|uniref:class I SAM-dependent methyltransferase n=1 Tax=Bradyrhizobium liaoningense TaxID=43992 RepID=UPI001BA97121|nr:class I SAM-dependent methyltransferase [Bradyrhizobium liaoningense]MBR0904589.1 class I SAM-dependent methyltransferase [Bradyrhizobium liaoningense]